LRSASSCGFLFFGGFSAGGGCDRRVAARF
jgi:hypothetical protein